MFGAGYRYRLQVRAECKQTAVAILHYKLTAVPWHVGKSAHEFQASSCILGVQRVRIFDEYVGVKQFFRIFVGVGCGGSSTAEMNRMLVALNDGINRRVLPRAQTLEAKLVLVIGESSGNVPGEEHGRNLTDHGRSLLSRAAEKQRSRRGQRPRNRASRRRWACHERSPFLADRHRRDLPPANR